MALSINFNHKSWWCKTFFLVCIFGVGDSERLVVRDLSDSDVERSRGKLLENSTEIAIQLLADGDNSRAILICDGTYERHQSSSNYSVQRGSYSTHKKDNFLKPFMIVSLNGYMLMFSDRFLLVLMMLQS